MVVSEGNGGLSLGEGTPYVGPGRTTMCFRAGPFERMHVCGGNGRGQGGATDK